jgi:hypothetical protein
MKKISNLAGVLLVAFALLVSGIAATANTEQQTPSANCSIGSGTVPGAIGPVVWDNGMDFTGLGAAQKDDNYPFYAEMADDFLFDAETEVADVHWVGGYWGTDYATAAWPWEITFYSDRGDQEAPGDVAFGPFEFDDSQLTVELIQDTGSSIYNTYSVDLDETITFPAGVKYWISIRGVGFFPPQSGWGYQDTVQLWECVFRSELLGYANWTDSTIVWGAMKDACFQLTGPLGAVPPTAPDIDGPGEGTAGTEICWTFHSSDENGDQVKYFIDWGDGTTDETALVDECTPFEVCHTYETKGDYVITAYAEDATGETGDSSTFSVTIPRARSVSHPVLFRLFERFPNMFPIFRQLFGL